MRETKTPERTERDALAASRDMTAPQEPIETRREDLLELGLVEDPILTEDYAAHVEELHAERRQAQRQRVPAVS